MSVQVSYKKQGIIFLCLFLVLLISLEIGSRVIEYSEENNCEFIGKEAMNDVDENWQQHICKDNNSILYEVDGILKYIPNQNMETININSHGFRGDEFSEIKDSDTYRIFLVGGSTVFLATSDDKTINSFLQEKLENYYPNKKFEVLNAGIGSAYSYSEKYLIQNVLTEFEPDLVIVYSGGNDANNRYGIDYAIPGVDTSQLTSETNYSEDPIKKIIKEIDYRTPYVLLKSINQFENNFQTSNSSKNQVQELWTERMNQICETNTELGIKSIILVQPMLGSGDKELSNYEQKLLEHYGVYMIDTLDILNKIAISLVQLENTCDATYDLRMIFDDTNEPLFFDHIHVNDLGSEIIAKEISRITIDHLQ